MCITVHDCRLLFCRYMGCALSALQHHSPRLQTPISIPGRACLRMHACCCLVTALCHHSLLSLGAVPRHSRSSRHASVKCLFCLCMFTTIPTEASCTAMACVTSMHGLFDQIRIYVDAPNHQLGARVMKHIMKALCNLCHIRQPGDDFCLQVSPTTCF